MCAVRRCVAVPALWHVSRPLQHAAVTRVHVPRVVLPSESTLAARATREAPVVPLHHDERCVGRSCCANDKHQRLYGREGRAEPEGALVHADVVPAERLGHVLACLPAWLLVADRLPTSDPHFLWGSLTYPWLT